MADVPFDYETEVEVLSAILQFPDEVLDDVRPILGGDVAFYDLRTRLIYRAALLLADAGEVVDAPSVRARLQSMPRARGGREDLLEEAGGAAFVFEVAMHSESSANTRHHARRLADMALKRRLIAIGEDMRRRAMSPVETGADLATAFRSDLDLADSGTAAESLVTMDDFLGRALEDLRTRTAGTTPGLSTGYSRLDDTVGGLRKSDLVILAARPSMGKTAFATNLILNMARAGTGVGVFSLETDEDGLAERVLGALAGVNTRGIRAKTLPTQRLEDVYRLGEEARAYPVVFDFRPDLGIGELRSAARRMHSRHGIGVLFIDYLQFMRPGRAERREAAFAEISKGLKIVAKELRIPVIALSQLSRQVEQRGGDKIPILSDLRESGGIEQDADMVLFLHRPGYYDRDKPKGPTQVICAKNRNGPTGIVNFILELETGQFRETSHEYEPGADSQWREDAF